MINLSLVRGDSVIRSTSLPLCQTPLREREGERKKPHFTKTWEPSLVNENLGFLQET
jgi:hypothetical protein